MRFRHRADHLGTVKHTKRVVGGGEAWVGPQRVVECRFGRRGPARAQVDDAERHEHRGGGGFGQPVEQVPRPPLRVDVGRGGSGENNRSLRIGGLRAQYRRGLLGGACRVATRKTKARQTDAGGGV